MNAHEQFAEDLSLYALGTLQAEERAALEKHLQECAGCRRELEMLRGDMALLAFSTGGPKPPARARQRLIDAVAREPRRAPIGRQRPWWALAPAFVAAAMAAMAVFFWIQSSKLQRDLAILEKRSAQQRAELQRAREIVATLTATDAMTVTLVAAKTPPQPQGKVMYVKDRASLIFLASNMPMPPSQKAYELWLIPMKGAPMPAGMFKPDAHGSAMVINPPLPGGMEAKTFAVTIEPETGSPTPTMPIVMMGAGA
ncbi:MAG TPA: anti-sigma factor [Terriglobales bacterium]|nr:anti-sigma factor [Terriglobales bacterium]